MLANGSKWSESWIAAGFTHCGTNVPKRIGSRIELSRVLAEFFAEHPEYEIPFASVTAAEAGRLQKAIVAAEEAVRVTKADVAKKKRVRDAAEKKLRHEMHFGVVYLGCKLTKHDPRWLAFGLKRPRPDAPLPPRRSCDAPAAAPIKIDFSPTPETAAEDIRAA